MKRYGKFCCLVVGSACLLYCGRNASRMQADAQAGLVVSTVLGPDGDTLSIDGAITFIAELEPYIFKIHTDTTWVVHFPSWCAGHLLGDSTPNCIRSGDTLHGSAALRLMPKRDSLAPANPNSCVVKDGTLWENQLVLHCGRGKKVMNLHVSMPIAMVYVAGVRTEGDMFLVADYKDWHEADREHFTRLQPAPVPESFYMSKYAVTQGQWAAAMDGVPLVAGAGGDPDRARYPVTGAGWHEVAGGGVVPVGRAFLSIVNDSSGIYRQQGKTYRLPTAVEWEYAARGGRRRGRADGGADNMYAGCNTGGNAGNGALKDYAWYAYNSPGGPQPVGQKLGNELGLYDMSGNVWEWTSDVYEESFRVVKGGCWHDSATHCRVSFWDDGIPSGGFDNVGFRLGF